MADIKSTFGTSADLTITLASLGDASGRASTERDNTTTKALSADIFVKVKTGASGVAATGYVSVYLLRSNDGTTYDDGHGGTDAAWTAKNAILLGSLAATANATTYYATFDTAQLGITLPEFWCVGIVNNSGAALDSTGGNHAVNITEKYLTSA